MPPKTYDFWRGEQSLIDLEPNAIDAGLRELVREYAAGDPQRREADRHSFDESGFYELLQFARRSAVFAMREKNLDAVRDGLSAVAMTRYEVADFRETLMSLSLLYYAADSLGADKDKLLRETTLLSEPRTAELIEGFLRRKPGDRTPRTMAGRVEIQTEQGPGFARWGGGKYDPTVDLSRLALEVSRLIAADKYQPDDVEMASAIYAHWLSRERKPELNLLLSRVRAVAGVSGKLRPREHPHPDARVFLIHIAETQQEADARNLRQLSRTNGVPDQSMLGVSVGRLFALVLAWSCVQGVPAYETPKSLTRFADGLAKILARHAKKAADSSGRGATDSRGTCDV